jgi:mono/diheme cytochrome c family protein
MNKIGPLSISVLIVCAIIFAYVSYNEYKVEEGRKAYRKYGCAQCHEAGSAPDLSKVKGKYDRAYIARFVENPEAVYREKGRAPINEGFTPMPGLHVTQKEAKEIAAFLTSQE